ncbi:MAG: alpha/beta-type small acid-soluble spore protein [Clostridia bacterium]|nr:alpha/beta-type small acid-soluble spore protein [Clostridia bacterium]
MFNANNSFSSASGSSSSSGNSNRVNVPEARAALDNMKFEIASELGINLKQGYNGDLPSRQAGYIGGYMVKNVWPTRTRTFDFGHRMVDGHRGRVKYRVRIIV